MMKCQSSKGKTLGHKLLIFDELKPSISCNV